jgi:hypothetical protein
MLGVLRCVALGVQTGQYRIARAPARFLVLRIMRSGNGRDENKQRGGRGFLQRRLAMGLEFFCSVVGW